MVDFNDAVSFLIDIGFVRVLAPFMLIFAIVFAILQKSKIFHGGANDDDSAKKINSVIAFVFALFGVISVNVFNFIENAFAIAAMVIVTILCMLIVLGLLLGDEYKKIFENNKIKYALAIGIFLLTLGFLFTMFKVWQWLGDFFSSFSGGSGDTIGFLLIFAVIGGAIYWITRSDDSN